jgi:hypothetical protein
MKNREIISNKQKLDHLFKKITAFSEDTDLQSHWARYLCILVSGFLETSVRIIYREYAKSKATPQVANFVVGKLEDFQNPKMEKILQLTGLFSTDWANELRLETDGELKDAAGGVTTPPETQTGLIFDRLVLKKDRSDESYTRPIRIYVT